MHPLELGSCTRAHVGGVGVSFIRYKNGHTTRIHAHVRCIYTQTTTNTYHASCGLASSHCFQVSLDCCPQGAILHAILQGPLKVLQLSDQGSSAAPRTACAFQHTLRLGWAKVCVSARARVVRVARGGCKHTCSADRSQAHRLVLHEAYQGERGTEHGSMLTGHPYQQQSRLRAVVPHL